MSHNPSAVIASEAKQSIGQRKERMDCFVASLLAMTGLAAGLISDSLGFRFNAPNSERTRLRIAAA
jgi:hypothetical protein